MPESFSPFVFMTCPRDSVGALKSEVAARFPDFRFSYSRGGFLTWRVGDSLAEERKVRLDVGAMRLIFPRCVIHSLGKIGGKTCELDRSAMLDEAVRLAKTFPTERYGDFRRVHVWEPDGEKSAPRGILQGVIPTNGRTSAGANTTGTSGAAPRGILQTSRGKEPGLSVLARALQQDLVERLAPSEPLLDAETEAALGDLCLDVIPVAPKEWWVGFHYASDFHSRYPGGLIPLEMPTDAASRAWLKFEEGLRWSGFPIAIGSRCADIGSSPGGGSQALLARGAEVLGVDPAEMAPQVLQNPNFTHLRGRISQLKRKNFLKTRWVIADMNVAPSYTLDVLEEFLVGEAHRGPAAPNVRGALFTLKLFDWGLAGHLPEYLRRIKSFGFTRLKVRQLTFNHREVMVCATRKRD